MNANEKRETKENTASGEPRDVKEEEERMLHQKS
jgi:hypothetical protein